MAQVKHKKNTFICQSCGYASPKWIGKCPECGSWNSLVEEPAAMRSSTGRQFSAQAAASPQRLEDIHLTAEIRLDTGMPELNHVLGGGIVQGSVVLLGGAPGIGKSTLLLQVCAALTRQGHRVLYVSAEESVRQTRLRAERLDTRCPDLLVVSETNLDTILEYCRQLEPSIVIADSIQVLFLEEIGSAAGSVSQVRECAARLTMMAKHTGTCLFLVGHLTKDGAIAGPRVLEHLVDSVLYFEGEQQNNYRILRAVKNRFGSTNEIGIFEMTGQGLQQVDNPSGLFVSNRAQASSGSAVVATMEGTRPLLVEIQALASPTTFGYPRRQATGIDLNRAQLLIAVLEKRAQVPLQTQDVFLNVAGGIKIVEPAVDVAVIAAVFSSFRDKALPESVVFFGEVGLGGEIRAVPNAAARLNEASRMGFSRAILPAANMAALTKSGINPGIELTPVATVEAMLEVVS